MAIINLIVGDWSDDGHGRTSSFTIEANMPLYEVENSYKMGVLKTGLDLTEDVACDYQDPRIRPEQLQKLQRHGFKFEDDNFDVEPDKNGVYLSPEMFVEMYLFLARLGEPGLTVKHVSSNHSTIHVGGYGLFE